MNLEKFQSLGLSEKTLRAIEKKGFEEPTEIQEKIIPAMLNDVGDIIGQAQTGTGKTAAFGLPLMEILATDFKGTQALILVPTRELAIQVSEEINSFKGKRKLHILPIYGGQSISDQLRRIQKGSDIIIGTPGRILDHISRKSLMLDRVSYVILDEADEMLNMGFIDEVEEIMEHTNPARRTLLFSATIPDRIMKSAKKFMKNFRIITIKKAAMTVDLTDQIYFEVAQQDKFEALTRIIDMEKDFYGLIFCRTKVLVDEIASKLIDRGYDAEGIHGDLSQHLRERILEKFRKQHATILVATDVAARGIDVTDLTHVINYSLPQDSESYIHRIGRTGRAGKKGIAITFISPDEYRQLKRISMMTKSEIRKEKVPAGSDIVKMKKTRIMAELKDIIKSGNHREYMKTAMEMLESGDPTELIASFLKHYFEDELDEKKYRDIRSISVDHKGKSRLFVSFGRKDGLNPRKLIKMINNETRVSAGKISEVRVMETFSFLTVPFEEAEIILKSFKRSDDSTMPIVQRANDMKSMNKKGKR